MAEKADVDENGVSQLSNISAVVQPAVDVAAAETLEESKENGRRKGTASKSQMWMAATLRNLLVQIFRQPLAPLHRQNGCTDKLAARRRNPVARYLDNLPQSSRRVIQ